MLNGSVIKSFSELFILWWQFSPLLALRSSKNALVEFLILNCRVPVVLLSTIIPWALSLLDDLRLRKSLVHHILIVADHPHLPSESLVPMVLRFTEEVIFLLIRRSVRLAPLGRVIQLGIVPKVIVEGSLVPRWLIDHLEASGTIGDVGVTTTTVVGIVNWFWMDVSQRLSGPLLRNNEWAYRQMIKWELYLPISSTLQGLCSGAKPPLIL